ncbi:unnamed protein product [Dicrocoelium dendriticum]|nr:unnamed protein product [Dicrocoelium dendriticum]
MSSYRPGDSKREEFRKYLEKSGVLDTLTRVLVGLYEEPEKPENALEFIRKHMRTDCPDTAEVEAMRVELAELRKKVEMLEKENTELKRNASDPSGATSAALDSTPVEGTETN